MLYFNILLRAYLLHYHINVLLNIRINKGRSHLNSPVSFLCLYFEFNPTPIRMIISECVIYILCKQNFRFALHFITLQQPLQNNLSWTTTLLGRLNYCVPRFFGARFGRSRSRQCRQRKVPLWLLYLNIQMSCHQFPIKLEEL